MNKKDFNWAPIIPLIGGFSLGAYEATGKKPVGIYSYTPFTKNDSHIANYWADIEYKQFDNEDDEIKKQKLDFVVCLPPCAALSSLNTGKREEVRGGCAVQNEWMFESARRAIEYFDPEVIITENAPGLYSKKGEQVADKLYEIAKENNRSITLYKTSTHYHGIPQRRDRTFFFMWKSKTAPIVNYYKREHELFEDYLKHVKEDDLQQDIIINDKVSFEPYYQFVEHYTGKNGRDVISGHGTAFKYINKHGLLDEFIKWCHDNDKERGAKLGEHAKYKFSIGKGIWDSSTHVFKERMNAVIGRNMSDTIHPTENRSLSIREALYMMGFPKDFELLKGKPSSNHIAQNVPVCSARDMVYEAQKFINGELEMSTSDFIKQNNWKERIEYESKSAEDLNELPV